MSNKNNISIVPMTEDHLVYWNEWVNVPHVKNTWFLEGYEPPEYMLEKLKGNGYDYPFIICLDNKPIGYLSCSDLYAYKTLCDNPKGVFTNEEKGTWCIDLFIAREDCLNKGYGTLVMNQCVNMLIDQYGAKKIMIDPAADNQRAIHCYKKAGFVFERMEKDGVANYYVMRYTRLSSNAKK